MARRAILVLLVLLVAGGAGFLAWRQYGPVPISRILARPADFEGRTVTITGKVQTSMSLLGQGLMQVNDGSGSLWAARSGAVPPPGTEVRLRGSITTMLQVGTISVVGMRVAP